MADYNVVFDVVRSGYTEWWFPASGIFVTLFVLALSRFQAAVGGRLPSRWFERIVVVFGVVWTCGAAATTYRDHSHLVAAVHSDRLELVEGCVESITPQPSPADEDEVLVVAGRSFEYSDALLTGAFNQTLRKGSPLRVGQWVRVWHFDGRIVRLGIMRLPNNRLQPPAPCRR